ncbi:MAG: YihA family ribosome biogenesis GTP-binding protein [Flavobacteriales bacterium]|nr:YihA family ribosome biogenesis GTP-binding protein [Flavobacteriales bacterium]
MSKLARIHNVHFVKSSSRVNECPETDLPEFAFIGRSNVGKSSLINMLCDRKDLAKTSSKPGKTKLINHFEVDESWCLVDLPGYGYASVSKKERETWPKMIRNYLLQRENLYALFVLIDIRLKPQPIDLEFIQQLGEGEIPFSIVFTKQDKLKPSEASANVKAFKRAMLENWESLPPIFITSSTKKYGGEELLTYIRGIIEEARA